MDRQERHFEKEEERLKETILRLGSAVEAAIADAIRALTDRDPDVARKVLARDEEIDQLELEIDQICTDIIALYQPAARDLRFVIAALKIAPELERIGDLAGNISERAVELCEEPQLKPFIDIPRMAQIAREMVKESLDALVRRDADAARAAIARDDGVDALMEQLFRELHVVHDRGPAHDQPRAASDDGRQVHRADRRRSDEHLRDGRLSGGGEGHPPRRPASVRAVQDVRGEAHAGMDLRKRILIVEDDEDIALSLKYNLEKEGGYLVQTAADGEGACGPPRSGRPTWCCSTSTSPASTDCPCASSCAASPRRPACRSSC